ncbi:MAG: hypothetical protein HC918_14195 [Oscillatoriales cyanobacterium SM2_1_8]|nr:hypothetical protein [Oscillatoriales cyanobacterium SM2_1_8]
MRFSLICVLCLMASSPAIATEKSAVATEEPPPVGDPHRGSRRPPRGHALAAGSAGGAHRSAIRAIRIICARNPSRNFL